MLLCAATTLVACSDEDMAAPAGPSGGGDRSGGAATGPGISVAQARVSKLAQPLLVTGFIVADGEHVRLCEVLAESYPPQCGGQFLEVRGLDVSSIPVWSPSRIRG